MRSDLWEVKFRDSKRTSDSLLLKSPSLTMNSMSTEISTDRLPKKSIPTNRESRNCSERTTLSLTKSEAGKKTSDSHLELCLNCKVSSRVSALSLMKQRESSQTLRMLGKNSESKTKTSLNSWLSWPKNVKDSTLWWKERTTKSEPSEDKCRKLRRTLDSLQSKLLNSIMN